MVKVARAAFALLKVGSVFLLFWSVVHLGSWLGDKNYLMLLEGQRTEGQIVEVEKRLVESNRQSSRTQIGYTAYVPTVEFVDTEGKRRKFIDRFGTSSAPEIGDRVVVLFAKSNSEIAIIDKGHVKNWLELAVYLAVLLGGLLGLGRFWRFKP